MIRKHVIPLVALVCAMALSCGLLAGCANGAANSATAEQQASRSYMSQVNELMEQLGKGLDSFNDAVSRNDVVNMRTQAENAYKVLDQLADLEAPEALSDVKEKYVDGTKKLRSALDAYITLYTDMQGSSFDQSTYNSRIAEVQKLYDEGIDLLKQGDEAAASKA